MRRPTVGLDERPRTAADHGDWFTVFEELFDQVHGVRIHAEIIRVHDSAGKKQRIIITRPRLIEVSVDLNFLTPLGMIPAADRPPLWRHNVAPRNSGTGHEHGPFKNRYVASVPIVRCQYSDQGELRRDA